jgi:hypothetical protein
LRLYLLFTMETAFNHCGKQHEPDRQLSPSDPTAFPLRHPRSSRQFRCFRGFRNMVAWTSCGNPGLKIDTWALNTQFRGRGDLTPLRPELPARSGRTVVLFLGDAAI